MLKEKLALQITEKKLNKRKKNTSSDNGLTNREWLGVSILTATSLYLGFRFVKKKIANREQGKSFGDDIHATWADQIHNAITNDGFYYGTDEKALRAVLVKIPSREDFEKVEKSYKKQFNGNMTVAIRKDLSTSEYEEMLAIIESKPNKAKNAGGPIYDPFGWAKRLNAAINYRAWGFLWGTDEDAITQVILEMPSQQAFVDTAEVYKGEFGALLVDDLKADLEPYEIVRFERLIRSKPLK